MISERLKEMTHLLATKKVTLGVDGFVDEIVKVVRLLPKLLQVIETFGNTFKRVYGGVVLLHESVRHFRSVSSLKHAFKINHAITQCHKGFWFNLKSCIIFWRVLFQVFQVKEFYPSP